ncbi:MAG: ABC transporter substrate-binding protein, partial [Thermodesulfobacteriota bacterium]
MLTKKKQLNRNWESTVIFFFSMFLIIIMLGVLSSCQKKEEIKLLKIGLPEEPKSLNLWLGTDSNSRKILSLIYQPLYTRDPKTLEMIPWLAKEEPVFDKEKLTYTVKLRKAKWSDGSEFTSEDVLFTKKFFFDFKIPRYYSKWKTIKKLEAIDKHTIVFHLKKPSAIFLSRVLTAPMISKKEWEQIAVEAMKAEKPLKFLQDHSIKEPLGTGPFTLFEYKKGAYLHMKKNPHFFGTGKTIANH